MLIVTYDIQNDKTRTKYARFLSKFGYRLQYSVFEIKNSRRILDIIQTELESVFGKKFEQTDSVIIFDLSKQCKIHRFGYAKNDDDDIIII